MNIFETFHIPTTVHGLYLIEEAKSDNKSPLLVGFHGYGETAEAQMQMIQQIPGIEGWTCCSIQALHSFYNVKSQIGYSWMTSENRELRIQENVVYINSVISEIKKMYPVNEIIVFHGFSQGTAMACRAALLGGFSASGVILLGGDIPIEFKNLSKMHRLLFARGNNDKFFPVNIWKNNVSRIKNSDLDFSFCTFDGGHEAHEEYYKAVREFLNTINNSE
jgi:predicted esterase